MKPPPPPTPRPTTPPPLLPKVDTAHLRAKDFGLLAGGTDRASRFVPLAFCRPARQGFSGFGIRRADFFVLRRRPR